MSVLFTRAVSPLLRIAVLGLWLSACGGGDQGPAPFVLQVNSLDVVQTAVNRIELVFDPGDLDRGFEMGPDRSIGGEVFTRTTGAGEFVITLEQGFIDRNAEQREGFPFVIEVPLQGAQTGVADDSLRLQITFIRGDERIARGERFLSWPLAPGGVAVTTVQCIRPAFSRQCTNNPGVDAGPPPPDGGVDAGPPPTDAGTDAGPPPADGG